MEKDEQMNVSQEELNLLLKKNKKSGRKKCKSTKSCIRRIRSKINLENIQKASIAQGVTISQEEVDNVFCGKATC